MAKGNKIIVSSNPQGKYLNGTVSGTPKPGTMMEISAISDNTKTWQAYQPGTDGEQRLCAILLDNDELGRDADTAYVDGDRCRLYVPVAGEEMNVLFGNAAGTADDVAVGDVLMPDTGTGKFVNSTGSPEMEPFQSLEVYNDPTADKLLHCIYTGY